MFFIIKGIRSLIKAFCGGSSQQEPSQQQQQQQWHPQQQQPQYPTVQQPTPVYPPTQPLSQQPHPKPTRPQQHPSPYPHSPRPDPNQVNQHDSHYTDLRKRANEEGDAMAQCFQESHDAYARGDGAGAKDLSNQGKDHQRKMEQLNKQASDWIYFASIQDSKPGEIDLHGLYVKEAIERTDYAIQDAKRRGDTEVHLIVGKGLHSSGGVAKIKPAIEELMQKHQLVAELDPNNAGVLLVQLGGHRDRAVGPDEIARRLNRDEEGCIVM
ncbi:hypothetical protein F5879DRAFT_796715 [Lentinula edodes]|nr:hypothetical protein F5051DRAFT_458588 [Lentinula edodes]KAJ3906965.1 hypothetical protein F5879DRAFT_796715 [Lentinula edodes]KAJ3915984.1 hypothetical protein F5877DRAFT_47510 [Lentinula edodes]